MTSSQVRNRNLFLHGIQIIRQFLLDFATAEQTESSFGGKAWSILKSRRESHLPSFALGLKKVFRKKGEWLVLPCERETYFVGIVDESPVGNWCCCVLLRKCALGSNMFPACSMWHGQVARKFLTYPSSNIAPITSAISFQRCLFGTIIRDNLTTIDAFGSSVLQRMGMREHLQAVKRQPFLLFFQFLTFFQRFSFILLFWKNSTSFINFFFVGTTCTCLSLQYVFTIALQFHLIFVQTPQTKKQQNTTGIMLVTGSKSVSSATHEFPFVAFIVASARRTANNMQHIVA